MANKVVITTDTGSDLRPENLKKYHIDGMIPFHITLGDKSYKDFYECQPNDLFRFFEEHNQVPKTAACSPHDFLEFFEPFAQQGCDIVHIAMNSVFSSSYAVRSRAAMLWASKRCRFTFLERSVFGLSQQPLLREAIFSIQRMGASLCWISPKTICFPAKRCSISSAIAEGTENSCFFFRSKRQTWTMQEVCSPTASEVR